MWLRASNLSFTLRAGGAHLLAGVDLACTPATCQLQQRATQSQPATLPQRLLIGTSCCPTPCWTFLAAQSKIKFRFCQPARASAAVALSVLQGLVHGPEGVQGYRHGPQFGTRRLTHLYKEWLLIALRCDEEMQSRMLHTWSYPLLCSLLVVPFHCSNVAAKLLLLIRWLLPVHSLWSMHVWEMSRGACNNSPCNP